MLIITYGCYLRVLPSQSWCWAWSVCPRDPPLPLHRFSRRDIHTYEHSMNILHVTPTFLTLFSYRMNHIRHHLIGIHKDTFHISKCWTLTQQSSWHSASKKPFCPRWSKIHISSKCYKLLRNSKLREPPPPSGRMCPEINTHTSRDTHHYKANFDQPSPWQQKAANSIL